MSTIVMAEFVSDDTGALDDQDTAGFVRKKKLPNAKALDFKGVKAVTAAFLDRMFEGVPLTTIAELTFPNANGGVKAAIDQWVDRASAPPVVKSRAPEPMPTPPAAQARPTFADAEDVGEKFTPTRLVKSLRHQLERYLEAAWPLSDPGLVRARRRLFTEADKGHLLAQEPFVETTPQYQGADQTYGELKIDPTIATFLDDLTRPVGDEDALLHPSPYRHQARALEAFLGDEPKNLVVATGTGSGKTECFLLPMAGMLLDEARRSPRGFARRGVRALILYPMNALVNDQVARLRLLFGTERFARTFRERTKARHPVFGMYTGRTPYAGPREAGKDGDRVAKLVQYYRTLEPEFAAELRALGRYPAKDLDAFFAEGEHVVLPPSKPGGKPENEYNWRKRLLTSPGDRELLTRHEMVRDPHSGQGASPDILVTNYSMLEYMLMRPFERPVFEETRTRLEDPDARFLLVLDEAHMYRGAKGAEVAFLLRRLFDRIGLIGHPDKLRVIATSASLGDRAEAELTARRFAADLTGLSPDRYTVVLGRRAEPRNPQPGGAPLADALAQIDLDALHARRNDAAPAAVLEPALRAFGVTSRSNDEVELYAALHAALAEHPVVQQVLASTAGNAVRLGALADILFPEHPHREKATQVLLTLGSLARTGPNKPGLLPTRVHLMFRGLNGLYACIDPSCAKRDPRDGVSPSFGALYATPRTRCECGARVLELASCRDCGTAYALAYAESSELSEWTFLWSEGVEDGAQVQLLPAKPRTGHDALEILVQLRTGMLLPEDAEVGGADVQSFWIASREGRRAPTFSACAMCQEPDGHHRARIHDLRTRGEQPFTALLETQFAEQPPQKTDRTLANRGRKVLVFSDGRQKAARLAPALAVGHAQDAFRQVLAVAVREMQRRNESSRLSRLYPVVLWVCAQRSVDLFPEAVDETSDDGVMTWRGHLDAAVSQSIEELYDVHGEHPENWPLCFTRALFNEVTERLFSLPQLGLGAVTLDPALHNLLLGDFPSVGLSRPQVVHLVDVWVRAQLERRCFLPPGVSPSKIPETGHWPDSIELSAADQVVPRAVRSYLQRVLGDDAKVQMVAKWFDALVRRPSLLHPLDKGRYLSPKMLAASLTPDQSWHVCDRCFRVQSPYPGAASPGCAACGGELAPAADRPGVLDARADYFREAVRRALEQSTIEPFGLTVKEHSAQLTGLSDNDAFFKTEQYELRFQDIRIDGKAPVDVLSCTTTMEVGIDIGALCGVALRNVPPHVASYQQRAGRAGRRGRAIASVVTYAHEGSHDAWYYDDPARIIAGEVRPPVVYVENRKVLERHVNAWLIQRFFHATVPGDKRNYSLFESMGTVRTFLTPETPCSRQNLVRWLRAREPALRDELRRWIPARCLGTGGVVDVDAVLDGCVDRLLTSLDEKLPDVDVSKLSEATAPTTDPEAAARADALRSAIEMQLDDNLLQALIDRAILPRYAFPTDTVTLWVHKQGRAKRPWQIEFDYQPQRDLQIALSEYAPGRSLTIDGLRFVSSALYNPYEPDVTRVLSRATRYASCRHCGYVGVGPEVATLAACPVCHAADLTAEDFIRPQGFAPDIQAKRVTDRGGAIQWAGESSPAKLKVMSPPAWHDTLYAGRIRLHAAPQSLIVVNKGLGGRGFAICPRCGAAEPAPGAGFTKPRLTGKAARKGHDHPTVAGLRCKGVSDHEYYLGYTFETDVLLLRLHLDRPAICQVADTPEREGAAGRAALTSLVEALSLAASRALQIDEGEFAGNWNPVPNGDPYEADVYLYDMLPGGAGYTRQVRDNLPAVLDETRRLLDGSCGCESSCHRCLRHWGNRKVHGVLDRRLALALLDAVTLGTPAQLAPEEVRRAAGTLAETLHLHGFSCEVDVAPEGPGAPSVPLVVTTPERKIWVDIHHPLVDHGASSSPVEAWALDHLHGFAQVDTWTVAHALPTALKAVRAAQ